MARQQTIAMSYARIPSAEISGQQAKHIKLDLATPEAFDLMRQFAADTYHRYRHNPEIQNFFSSRKSYMVKP